MKKIVFDLGAVLLHWRPQQMLMRELPHRATDAAQAGSLQRLIFEGFGGDWGEFDRGTLGVPELVQRIARRTGLAAADVLTVVQAVPRELQPIKHSVALLNRLGDAGHELHYLSNMPAPYADELEATHAFFKRFRSGVFSSRVHHIKPETAIFELAAARFGSAPQDLVLMDDQLPNVQAARALGWHALHFSDAAAAAAELRAAGWALA